MATEFSYHPLREDEIRLLYFNDVSSDYRLVHVNLAEEPAYLALSYTWGTTNAPRAIEIEGGKVGLSQNLHLFLESWQDICARGTQPKLPLWIDQLCINQNDVQEKNAQVSRMGRIYEAADSTIVWLGAKRNVSDKLFDELARRQVRRHSQRDDEIEHEAYSDLSGDLWTAVNCLLLRDYWTRAWIVQEVCLSSHIQLLCGNRLIDYDAFANFLQNLTGESALHNELQVTMSFFQWLLHLTYRRERWPQSTTWGSLSHLWTSKETFNCADVKDKVFSVMSLIRPEEQFAVDYGASTAQILFKVVNTYRLSNGGRNRTPHWSVIQQAEYEYEAFCRLSTALDIGSSNLWSLVRHLSSGWIMQSLVDGIIREQHNEHEALRLNEKTLRICNDLINNATSLEGAPELREGQHRVYLVYKEGGRKRYLDDDFKIDTALPEELQVASWQHYDPYDVRVSWFSW